MTNLEINQLIHSRVMNIAWDEALCRVCGWKIDPEGRMCRPDNCSMRPLPSPRADAMPDYAGEIGLAWRVIEKLTVPIINPKPGELWLDGLGFRCCESDEDGMHGRWRCILTCEDANGERRESFVTADTAPMAICLAALNARGAEVPEVTA